jgi:hypothetical protein
MKYKAQQNEREFAGSRFCCPPQAAKAHGKRKNTKMCIS